MIFRRLKCQWCFLNIYNLCQYLGSLFIKKNSLANSLPPERVVQQRANMEPGMVSLNALVQKVCQALLSNLPLGVNGSPIQRLCESSCVGRRLFLRAVCPWSREAESKAETSTVSDHHE